MLCSIRRTKVIDDESDYFSSGSQWLSDWERQALQAKEERLREMQQDSRRNKKITLDFAGRRVIEEEEGRHGRLGSVMMRRTPFNALSHWLLQRYTQRKV